MKRFLIISTLFLTLAGQAFASTPYGTINLTGATLNFDGTTGGRDLTDCWTGSGYGDNVYNVRGYNWNGSSYDLIQSDYSTIYNSPYGSLNNQTFQYQFTADGVYDKVEVSCGDNPHTYSLTWGSTSFLAVVCDIAGNSDNTDCSSAPSGHLFTLPVPVPFGIDNVFNRSSVSFFAVGFLSVFTNLILQNWPLIIGVAVCFAVVLMLLHRSRRAIHGRV